MPDGFLFGSSALKKAAGISTPPSTPKTPAGLNMAAEAERIAALKKAQAKSKERPVNGPKINPHRSTK